MNLNGVLKTNFLHYSRSSESRTAKMNANFVFSLLLHFVCSDRILKMGGLFCPFMRKRNGKLGFILYSLFVCGFLEYISVISFTILSVPIVDFIVYWYEICLTKIYQNYLEIRSIVCTMT